MIPEAELWTEVIVQAIEDLSSHTHDQRERSALLWFNSRTEAVGSFIWACNVINIDPDVIRSALRKDVRLN